jgi:subtilisin family serine protease
MDIMKHRHRFAPASGGRTPGGADHPVAVDEALPQLPPATRVTVGVVDTGLVLDGEGDQPHPWFGDHVFWFEQERDRLEHGHRDRHEPGYLADADGHGTFVTGVILREAPTARVIMRGVLDTADDGRQALGGHDDSNVAMAVSELAGDAEVRVINLSFAGGVFSNETSNLYEVIQAIHPRVAVVAAAGNGASDVPVWPAAYDEVISVGALDESGSFTSEGTPPLAKFSNCGDWVDAYSAGVQVLGPFANFKETGHDIYGIRPPQQFRGWAQWSGTSFASAMVSGRIAQMAIENDMNGADAAQKVLREAPKIFGDKAVWISRRRLATPLIG